MQRSDSELLAQVLSEVRSLHRAIEAIHRAIEATQWRPEEDGAVRELLCAIAAETSNRPFVCWEVFDAARSRPALRDALAAAGIGSGQGLGRLLADVERRPVAGLAVTRNPRPTREGVLWRVASSDSCELVCPDSRP